MILGTTTREQVKTLRKPQRWFAWRPVRLVDSRRAWLCYVWRWYPKAYCNDELQQIQLARWWRDRCYSIDEPKRKHTRRPGVPVLTQAYELFTPKAPTDTER